MKTNHLTKIGKGIPLIFLFLLFTFSAISQRKLIWRGTGNNNGNGSQLANYVDHLGNTFPTGSAVIQATDSLYFTEDNTVATHHSNITFAVGTVCAKIVITNNATNTPYVLNFPHSGGGGTNINGNLIVSGNISHILKGSAVPNELNNSNISLRISGNVSLTNPSVQLQNLHLSCAGSSGAVNVIDIPPLAFQSGYLRFDVPEASTLAGTSYSLPHDLIVDNVKILFFNGSFTSNGHLISTNHADPIYYSDSQLRSSIWFNVGGGSGKRGIINLANSKIISRGNIFVFGHLGATVSYDVNGTEFELHSANFLTSQLPAGEVPFASQRLYWNGIKRISFLSDGLDGNHSHFLDQGFYWSSISARSIYIDRSDFEFRGAGGDIAVTSQPYIHADTLILSPRVSRVGFSQQAPAYRFDTIVAMAGTCSSSLLFENLPDLISASGKIRLGSNVVLPRLSIRSIEVTVAAADSLTAGYDLGNNGTSHLSFTPPASQIYYWVAASGNWHDPSNWSIGTPTATAPTTNLCLPTIIDSVVFLSATANVSIQADSTAYCRGMLWQGGTNFSTSGGELFISGNFNSLAFSGASMNVPFHFVLGGNRTIQPGSSLHSGQWMFGHTGEYRLLGNLTGGVWSHYSGTVNTNTNTVNISRYTHPYDGYWSLYPVNSFRSRELIITNSIVNISGLNAWNVWANNFTLQALGSTLNLQAVGALTFTIQGTGSQQNYWNLNVVNNPNALTTFTSSINVTFNDMTFTGNTTFTDGGGNTTWGAHNMTFAKSYTYNFDRIDRLNLTGDWIITPPTCGGMTFFTAHVDSTFTVNATTAQNLRECMFTRINASPGAAFNITNGVDNSGNLNVFFGAAPGDTFYWRGGNPLNISTTQRINWDNGENWAINNATDFNPLVLSNPGRCIPGPGDSVVFDINSFTAGLANQVMINTTAYCRDIVWTPGVLAGSVFNFNNKRLDVYRSLKFVNTMQFQGSAPIHFLAAAGVNSTIDFGGLSLASTPASTFIGSNGDIFINGAGTFDILSDIPFRNFAHQNGTLNTKGHTLSGYLFGSYSSNVSGLAGSIRNLDLSTSTVRLTGGGRIFQMDYKDLTALKADSSTIESNSAVGAGEFRHIRIEESTIVHKYGVVKNFLKSFSFRNSNGPVNYLGIHSGDIRSVANGSRPSIRVRKIEYVGSSSTETYGNFEIDTFILGAVNNFYISGNYQINDTVISNGVVCRPSVVRGGIEYTHHTTPSTSENGQSNFISPTCDLKIQSVNMSRVTADISSCGTSNYWYSGIDGLNNVNWTFDPVNITPNSADTITVNCDNLPYSLTVPPNYGSGGFSTLWNTGETTQSINVTTSGTYFVHVNYGGGCVMSDTFVIIIQDTIAPSITCLPATTIASTANCELSIPDFTSYSGLTITDNCSSVGSGLIVTQIPSVGVIVPVGDTTIWIFAEDPSGNRDSCSFTLSVVDSTAPVFVSCINDSTMYSNISICGVPAPDFTSNGQLNITDNCNDLISGSITVTQSPAIGEIISVGNTTIWIIAEDASGNKDSCSFILTVLDTISPIINECISNTSITTNSGECSILLPDFTTNSQLDITDNCSSLSNSTITVTQIPVANTIIPIGTQTVWIYAEDESGNSDSCSFILTVIDNATPTINSCVSDTSFTLDETICSILLPDFTTSSQIDISNGCSGSGTTGLVITQSPVAGIVLPVGTTTVWIYVTDLNNNTDSCSFNVTVNSNIPPIVISPVNQSNCLGSEVTLSISNPAPSLTYEWALNGTVVATGSNYNISSINIGQAGLYTVTAVNSLGCSMGQSTVFVSVISCGIIIPEVLSPNNDGKNDAFFIEGLDAYPNTKVWIHNRWGTEVYQSDNYQNDWDGKSQSKLNFQGDDLPEGTYFYILQLGGVEGQPNVGEIYKGFVYLKP